MRAVLILAGILSVACLASGAHAVEPLYRVACPPLWPGPDGTKLPLSYANQWINWVQELGETDNETAVSGKGPGEVQMDCAYGKGGYNSPYRVTMILPGHPVRCYLEKGHSTRSNTWTAECETRPEEGGTLGPVSWRVAEQLGSNTTFFGFGLGQSAELIEAIARAGGFEVRRVDGGISLRRGEENLFAVLAPGSGRTSEIIWQAPETDSGRLAFDRNLTFRFGLRRTWQPYKWLNANTSVDRTIWRDPTGAVTVELYPDPRGYAERAHLIHQPR